MLSMVRSKSMICSKRHEEARESPGLAAVGSSQSHVVLLIDAECGHFLSPATGLPWVIPFIPLAGQRKQAKCAVLFRRGKRYCVRVCRTKFRKCRAAEARNHPSPFRRIARA